MTADHSANAIHYTAQLEDAEKDRLLDAAYKWVYQDRSPQALEALVKAVDRAHAARDNARRANHPAVGWQDWMDDFDPTVDYRRRIDDLQAGKVRAETAAADWDGDR